MEVITPIAYERNAVINKVVVVYDASKRSSHYDDTHLIEKQLMTADLIILNKCDLTRSSSEYIEKEVHEVNPTARIIRAVSCNVDLSQITEGTTACFVGHTTDVCDDEEYSSFSLRPDARLKRDIF